MNNPERSEIVETKSDKYGIQLRFNNGVILIVIPRADSIYLTLGYIDLPTYINDDINNTSNNVLKWNYKAVQIDDVDVLTQKE